MKTEQISNHNDLGSPRHLFALVREVDKQNENQVWATISTDEIDRYDEVVDPNSIRNALPAFIANPVILGCHQPRLATGEPPVIGNVVTETIQINERSIDCAILFDDDELGNKYARKYRKKVMRAFSIGFKPKRGEYQDRSGQKTWVWTEIELLEVSAVAVPANRGALARSKGYYDNEEIEKTINDAITERFERQQGWLTEQFQQIKDLIIGDSDELARHLLDDAEEPLADSDDYSGVEQQLQRIQSVIHNGG
jgi:HK97 family phage prohead protease